MTRPAMRYIDEANVRSILDDLRTVVSEADGGWQEPADALAAVVTLFVQMLCVCGETVDVQTLTSDIHALMTDLLATPNSNDWASVVNRWFDTSRTTFEQVHGAHLRGKQ
jgi:hypothetical protein